MRFNIDLHLSFGKDDEQTEPVPSGDSQGYLVDAGDTDMGLGFRTPGNYPLDHGNDEARES